MASAKARSMRLAGVDRRRRRANSAPRVRRPLDRIAQLLRALLTLEGFQVALGIFQLIGIPLAIWAIVVGVETLEQQRIASAWQILAQPGGGFTGKGYAITTLAELGQPLVDLSMGCPEDPPDPVPNYFDCTGAYDLRGVRVAGGPEVTPALAALWDGYAANSNLIPKLTPGGVQGSYFGAANLSGSSFERANLFFVNFPGAFLDEAVFAGSLLKEVDFGNSVGRFTIRDSHLDEVGFLNVNLTRVTLANNNYRNIYIGGAKFCAPAPGDPEGCNPTIDQDFLNASFFYASYPPVDLHLLPPTLNVRAGCPLPPDGWIELWAVPENCPADFVPVTSISPPPS